eukprot:6209863-Pleurochrysis_carterae.AAC.1
MKQYSQLGYTYLINSQCCLQSGCNNPIFTTLLSSSPANTYCRSWRSEMRTNSTSYNCDSSRCTLLELVHTSHYSRYSPLLRQHGQKKCKVIITSSARQPGTTVQTKAKEQVIASVAG